MDKYIEIEAVYNTPTEYYHHTTEFQHLALREALSRAPAADVAPLRHGRWVIKRDAMGKEYTICNACGLGFYNENSAGFERLDLRNCGYCPGCGAKMDMEGGL